MNTSRSYVWCVFLAMMLGLGGCFWYESTNRAHLDLVSRNLESCRALATKISELRQSPSHARASTRSTDDLASVIEKAAADAQLARDRVVRIDPQPPKRVAKSDYLDQTTEVELLNINLRQLVSFLFNLAASDSGLNVSTLRLQVPHSDNADSAETWLADIVLTQRIYAPTSRR